MLFSVFNKPVDFIEFCVGKKFIRPMVSTTHYHRPNVEDNENSKDHTHVKICLSTTNSVYYFILILMFILYPLETVFFSWHLGNFRVYSVYS